MSRLKNACFTVWTNFLTNNSQILPTLSNNFSGGQFSRVFFAVGSPLIPVTLSFSSAIWESPAAFAAIATPTRYARIAATPAYFPSNLQAKAEIASKPLIKTENPAKETSFCRLISQPQAKSTPLPPESQRYVISSSKASEDKPSQPNFSQKIISAIRNLFPWSKKSQLQETPSTVVMVRRSNSPQKGKKRWLSGSKQNSQSQVKEEWEVWVKGNLVAEFVDKLQADMFANSLADFLAERKIVGKEIKPAIAEGEPAAKFGEELLFVVDEMVSPEPRYQRELIAIKWLNRLRVALDTEPIKLAEAQRLMYGLVETGDKLEGLASWYGPQFHGRLTANGETFDQNALTAAHPNLPFDTYLKVTNLNNYESAIVRINDRGPYIPPRSLDVSWGVARCLNSEKDGVVPYRAVIMQPRGGSI